MIAVGDLLAEFGFRHARADFLLQRQAALGSVHDAHRFGEVHALRDGGEHQDELIHHKARVDAGADESDAFLLRGGVELRGKLGVLAERIRQLLAGGNDAAACLNAGEQLVHHGRERRRGRVHDDVDGLLQQGGRARRDGHAPGRVRCADDFAQVAPGLGRIAVDAADDYERFLLPQQTGDRGADGADAELHDANLLPHNAFLGPERIPLN